MKLNIEELKNKYIDLSTITPSNFTEIFGGCVTRVDKQINYKAILDVKNIKTKDDIITEYRHELLHCFEDRLHNLTHMKSDIKYIKNWAEINGAIKIYNILIKDLKEGKL